jgi:hypothetical protein
LISFHVISFDLISFEFISCDFISFFLLFLFFLSVLLCSVLSLFRIAHIWAFQLHTDERFRQANRRTRHERAGSRKGRQRQNHTPEIMRVRQLRTNEIARGEATRVH